MQFWPLFHLQVSDLQSYCYSLSSCRKPTNYAINLAFFCSNSINIALKANLKAESGRAVTTAQSRYRSYHDTIRTQTLNYSQCSARVEGTVKWNHSPFPTWPKSPQYMSGLGNKMALVAHFRILGGSLTGVGHPVRFEPWVQPANPELLLTLDIWRVRVSLD